MPCYYSENNYTTAMWIDEAIKKAGGKYPGPEEFIKIMASIKLDAPRGPVELDDMRNPIENVYIKKVEKKKMFGYDEGRALEHGDQDLPEGLAVLDRR